MLFGKKYTYSEHTPDTAAWTRWPGGMSLADIGRALGLSRERVRQIAERATEQLRGNTILQALAAEDVRTATAGPEVKTNERQSRRSPQRKAACTI